MLAQLSGAFSWWGADAVVVEAGGVGYLVFLSQRGKERLKARQEGEVVTLPVALVVREDALDLYGFANREEREMFLLLLSVPGVGPKSALSILAVAEPVALQQAVLEENPAFFTKVSGIGRKMAQKIILELKSRILSFSSAEARSAPVGSSLHEEVAAALRSLGYSAQEARDAVAALPPDREADFPHLLREALRNLGKKAV